MVLLIAIYNVRWVVDLRALSLSDVCKCLIILLFCISEINKKLRTSALPNALLRELKRIL